jgi:hypothetical protein
MSHIIDIRPNEVAVEPCTPSEITAIATMESPAKASADNGAPARQSRACPPFLRGQHKISKKWAYRAGPAAIAAVVVLVTALALVEPASAAPRGQQQAAPVTATAALPAPAARQEPKAAPTALAYTPSHSWHRASIVLVSHRDKGLGGPRRRPRMSCGGGLC